MVRIQRRFNPMVTLREVDRQFNEFMNSLPDVGARVLNGQYPAINQFPPMNIWDEGETVVVEAELPGVKEEQLEISVIGAELTIKGERPAVQTDREVLTYLRQERGTGAFARVLQLPVEVDSARVEATLRDGVLTVRLPKVEAVKPRKIVVNTVANG